MAQEASVRWSEHIEYYARWTCTTNARWIISKKSMKMIKKELSIYAAFGLISLSLLVASPTAYGEDKSKYTDLNGDGLTTYDEMLQCGCTTRHSLFLAVNKDKSGALTKIEIRTGWAYLTGRKRCPKDVSKFA